MDVVTYTGTASGAVVSTPNMSPDVVWIKDRGNTFNHQLFDTIRGANSALLPNLTSAATNYNSFTSFDSTGFTVPNVNGTGANGNNHVAWTWDAGSSTVTNTDGTVASQVRANPTAGISIVYVTANETTGNGGTVGHGLGKKPEFIIQKNVGATTVWTTQHVGLGGMSGHYIRLNQTIAGANDPGWNISEPTSSVMSIDPGYLEGNTDADVIYYVFAPVEGFSAFGSYTGSTTLPFIYTGFRPRWILFKRTDATNNWFIVDTERDSYNGLESYLSPDLSNAEATAANIADAVSNGFKLRGASNYYGFNATGGTYIYAAFAEHPFKTSRAR
jgi:hypothetical protein